MVRCTGGRTRRQVSGGPKVLARVAGAVIVTVSALTVGLVVQSTSTAAAAQTSSAVTRAASPVGSPLQTCFWRGPLDGKGKNNAAFPDLNASYWTAVISLPTGAHLNIDGSYPHARDMSFNSYDQSGVATSSIDDVAIQPDPGSTDPFVAGASRTATARGYSLSVLDQPTPTSRPPTLCTPGSVARPPRSSSIGSTWVTKAPV